MGLALNYLLDDVFVTLGGVPITEFADGDAISGEFTEDDWLVTQGSHGSVVRSRRPNNVLELTLRIMQGSPTNDWLSMRANLDRRTGLGTFSALVKDGRGTSLIAAAQAWVKKLPGQGFATQAGQREWVIVLASPEVHVGSNFPA